MSLLELIFESRNPGTVGSVSTGRRKKKPVDPITAVIRFMISVVFLGSLLFLFVLFVDPSIVCFFWVLASVLVYLLLSVLIDPRPDMTNVGWVGGLVDNPFRYSDDINRSLLWLKILLFPGRLLAFSLADMFRVIVLEKKK